MTRPADETCSTCNDFPRDAIKPGARGKCAIKAVEFAHESPACPIYQAAGDHIQRREIVASLDKSKIVG